MKTQFQLVRPSELAELLGVSRSTVWRMEKAGILPPRLKISSRAVGWRLTDIEEFVRHLEAEEGKYK